MKIKIRDGNFAHDNYSSLYGHCEYFSWDRTESNPNDLVFVTNGSFHENIKGTKIAWLIEPPAIDNNSYETILKTYKEYKYVLSSNNSLENKIDNFKFCPTGGCWILEKERQLYDKSKLVSIIASSKTQTQGHIIRHGIVQLAVERDYPLDVYGRGYNPIDNKITGLKDYAFSFTIENSQLNYYFTEKLIDCFMTGTVPIYWGCPDIGKFFNTDGMIDLNDLKYIHDIWNILSFGLYNSKKKAIEENFELAKKYIVSEDYIWENILKNELQ